MSKSVRILLADDHAIVREGIRLILQSESDLAVVGEVATGREAIAFVAANRPNVVIMDISMPDINGVDATAAIKRDHPDVEVLALTMHDSEEHFFRLLQAGASGYVLKGGDRNDLLAAIRTVAAGGVYLPPHLAKSLVGDYLHRKVVEGESAAGKLTDREVEILRLIAEGRTNREIAESLVLSVSTVERHRANIMAKLGLHSRADLIKFAIREGIVGLEG